MAPNHLPPPTGLESHRFPVEPWRLVETEVSADDLGHTETLFGVGNGYVGMRGNPEEGRDAHTHGTYINGFHETWEIQHAENAFGFAKVGQTIVNVPDAKLIKLYVDDEPLLLATADLEEYERAIDFRSGLLTRDLIWRTPGGKRVRVRSTRMVSMTERHLAVMTFEVTMLDAAAPIVISSQLLNRQDGEDEYHVPDAALGEGDEAHDPRQARLFDHRVLQPTSSRNDTDESGHGNVVMGYTCTNSAMTLACGFHHEIECESDVDVETTVNHDKAKSVIQVHAEPGVPITITKFVSYHTSTGVPCEELADRCARTLDRATHEGVGAVHGEQRSELDRFWAASDIEIEGDHDRTAGDALEPVPARAGVDPHAGAGHRRQGRHRRRLRRPLLLGHRGVRHARSSPTPTPSRLARLLRFRWHMLDAARQRADVMNQRGGAVSVADDQRRGGLRLLRGRHRPVPHQRSRSSSPSPRYLDATGDVDFLAHEGAEILVETARLWADLGFYATNNSGSFHIHRVTGPDEYTTVVNDNCYTNVMARFNLRYAARHRAIPRQWNPEAFDALRRRTDLELHELDDWDAAADAMFIPFDDERAIHPQDTNFLDLEPWDWDGTPEDKLSAPAELPPARDLPPPGPQAGRRGARHVPAVGALHRRTEAAQLRLLRPDHHRRLVTVGLRAGHRRRSGRPRSTWRSTTSTERCTSTSATATRTPRTVSTSPNCGGVWAGIVHGFAGMTETRRRAEVRAPTPRSLAGRLDSVCSVTVRPSRPR